jgi:predicted aspartyl protease
LAEIIGHVDTRDRPIVSLTLPGLDDDLLVIVDTGFNGQLLIYETELSRFNFVPHETTVPVELAGRERRRLSVMRSRITWFGQVRDVDVFVAPGGQRRAALPDESVGLLGTALLCPHRLTIDFATRRVVISESET